VSPQGLSLVVCDFLRRLERFDVSRPRPRLALAHRQGGEIIGAKLKDLGQDVSVPASKDLGMGAVGHKFSVRLTPSAGPTECTSNA
jgi:hypothetical protein